MSDKLKDSSLKIITMIRNKAIELIDYEDIDQYIIKLIKLLNEKGFKTIFCCSGLFEEHNGGGWLDLEGRFIDINQGYIVFQDLSCEQEEYLIKISNKYGFIYGVWGNNKNYKCVYNQCELENIIKYADQVGWGDMHERYWNSTNVDKVLKSRWDRFHREVEKLK